MTVVSGLLGTFLGGWLGDGLLKRTDKAYLLVSGWGMILAVPFVCVGFTATDRGVYVPALFVAEVLVFRNTRPANAVTSTRSDERGRWKFVSSPSTTRKR